MLGSSLGLNTALGSMNKLMVLVTSSLVVVASSALAQGNSDACHNQYGSCVERCSSRPQSVQTSCSQSCETSTNQCYGKMYGSPSPAALVSTDKDRAPQSETNEAGNEITPADGSRKPKRAQGAKAGKKAAAQPRQMPREPQAQLQEAEPLSALQPLTPPVAQVPQSGSPN
jgi:hypothetical protein